MKNKFKNSRSCVKRNWLAPLIGAIASLAMVFAAVLPLQAMAAEAGGTFAIIIGAPGSGKTTVSEFIRELEGLPIIEVGQLLTDEIAAASRSTARGRTVAASTARPSSFTRPSRRRRRAGPKKRSTPRAGCRGR